MTTSTAPTARRSDVGWLLTRFAHDIPGMIDAVVVSADGLLVTMSEGLPRELGDQLAAIVAGLTSLTRGAAGCVGAGQVRQQIVEFDHACLFVMTISDGSTLAAVTTPSCDAGVVGFEMAALVEKVGRVLTPALVTDLQAALPR